MSDTMKRKERQQKFHDSLVNMLYAPPLPPPHQNQFDDQTLNFAREIVNSDSHHINTDELEEEDETNLSSSSEEQGELGFQKLTRAQRETSKTETQRSCFPPETGGEASACIKVKHRRTSKKAARDKSEMPPTNFSHGAANHGAQS
ncbi:hypothetical protein L1987_24463 [Smallanthus sonchifolius]|uniref:Uncharacterized protein n=1 Tax=Smallanthus sonchifolius TaxID=185202 RepID=A0ACB9IN59_9ASTR|nr:hypothetical protein L1987_24463 [Smallanthus sonchifolius]